MHQSSARALKANYQRIKIPKASSLLTDRCIIIHTPTREITYRNPLNEANTISHDDNNPASKSWSELNCYILGHHCNEILKAQSTKIKGY